MLKVTKTALVVSALTLGSMSAASAGSYLLVPSNGSLQFFSEKEINTIRNLATYGGVYTAALDVNQSTVDLINSRAQANNKNVEMWLTPIYSKSSRSSTTQRGGDFDIDVSLTGINIGFENSIETGSGFGAIFNFGKVSTDGTGAASDTENDADYFSFGMYGTLAWDALKVTADMVLSEVKNEFEGTTPTNNKVGKVKADVDTYIVSLGLTGNYTFNTSFADITPHLAVRYTSIDLEETPYFERSVVGTVAQGDIKTVDMFSVPFGVTVSKSIKSGDWNLAPKFDVTLTSYFGDREYDFEYKSRTFRAYVVNKYQVEFQDSFTYGATLGLDAKYKDCLDLGLGLGYTGSSNSDKLNVTANIGYIF